MAALANLKAPADVHTVRLIRIVDKSFKLTPDRLLHISEFWPSSSRLVKQTFTQSDNMLIKIGYDIALRFPIPTTVIHLLHVHPTRRSDLVEPEHFSTEPVLPLEKYYDGFGNHRGRLRATAGTLRILSETVIRDSGAPDPYAPNAAQLDISELPPAALEFLLPPAVSDLSITQSKSSGRSQAEIAGARSYNNEHLL
jgi:hypothetical protein